MGAEDGDTWAETVRKDAMNRGGVARPSGRWGEGGQGVRLRFGTRALCWRYETIYRIEINSDPCRRGIRRGSSAG